ncbi:MAG TPA: methyltransferase domain-containing protein [Abditibacteriaceae bacterium]|nr:methyltransferase domain-containing protein [Abditibacteriaceae bacterium]
MHVNAINDIVINLWAYLHKKRKVRLRSRHETVKVNVGCGLIVAKGWLNLDVSLATLAAAWPRPLQRALYKVSPRASYIKRHFSPEEFSRALEEHNFIHHDTKYGLPFAGESVDYIYTSHFVEHLYRSHAQKFFEESRRVLKKGGVLRISVPDLEYVVGLYNAGRKEEAMDFCYYDAGTSEFTRHKYMYDFELMQRYLQEAGFSDIRRCSYREGQTPDIETLDGHPGYSLFVEAIK